MEKNIKDYLRLYLGCNIQVTHERYVGGGYCGKLIGIDETAALVEYKGDSWEKYEVIKPILRKLSDMTEEERAMFSEIVEMETEDYWCMLESAIKQFGEGTLYLLSKHFDLFGLIESGLAIDATKQPTVKS